MNSKFTNRIFDADLIKRQLKSLNSEIHGKNGESMNRMMEIGKETLSNGGLFDVEHDTTLKFKSAIVQSKEMRSYADIYNDYIILDGTHGTNKYRLIMMPTTVVDCLGKSIISGIGLCEAETKKFSSKLLERCGLINHEGTIMTDEGSAFVDLAITHNMSHILCAHHFQRKTVHVKGLCGDLKIKVFKAWNDLLFKDFENENKWKECFQTAWDLLDEENNSHETAIKFMSGLLNSRSKVCYFYTKVVFTCGHLATSRGEGTNGRIKGNGALKKVLSKSELDRSVSRCIYIFKSQEASSLKLIKGLIVAKKYCSKFVNKKWTKNSKHASKMNIRENMGLSDDDTVIYECVYKNSNDIYSTVTIPRVPGDFPPSCTCGTFMSMRIPCTCICAVYNNQSTSHTLFVKENLHPRWRLENHPLYEKAKMMLGISCGGNGIPDATGNNIDGILGRAVVDIAIYDNIEFPDVPASRYARLKERFDEAARLAVGNIESYKKLFITLSAAVNHLNNTDTPEEMPMHILQPQAASANILQPQPAPANILQPTRNNNVNRLSANILQPPRNNDQIKKRGRVSSSDVQNRAKFPRPNNKKQQKRIEKVNQYLTA